MMKTKCVCHSIYKIRIRFDHKLNECIGVWVWIKSKWLSHTSKASWFKCIIFVFSKLLRPKRNIWCFDSFWLALFNNFNVDCVFFPFSSLFWFPKNRTIYSHRYNCLICCHQSDANKRCEVVWVNCQSFLIIITLPSMKWKVYRLFN